MKKPNVKQALIMELNPLSPISETYHSLRAGIEFSIAKQEIKVITLTSSQRGEGKTTTAMNLALAYSRSGKKVLLIDADLRNPTLHTVFGHQRRDGLTNCLAGQAGICDVIKETPYSNLHLITSGSPFSNSTELLSSQNLHELFGELRCTYDRVIVDAPPLLAVIDSQIVAAATDGVVMIVEYGKTARSLVLKSAKILEHIRTPLLGTVINKAGRKASYAY